MMHPIQDRFRTTWQALPHPDRRWVLAALISCVCTVAVYFGLWFARPKPPLLLLDQARMALSAARHADAPTYAPKLWQEAEDSWEYTVRAFREQRRRWFFRRDFSTAARLAQRTHTLALQAQTRALAARDSLAEHARTAATAAQREIDEYRAHFRDLPGSRTYRERAVRSELLLLEAQAAARRGDLLRAAERLREARAAISLAGNGSANTVRAYFAKVPTWQKWAEETIAYSKEHACTVIIVDKFAHTCRVYRAGKPVAEFPVELGQNWMGHKRHRGDNATPEGHYVVTQKKARRSTIYHKALVINYPNETDRRQFEADKRSGQLPPGAQIGGLIEIHGEGGRGFDWTNGCVALTNADMDRLYDMVDVGTRVTIVGSLRTWESCFRGTNYVTVGTK